jgi:anion-transporting  ArsA/GET3 family ATPase
MDEKLPMKSDQPAEEDRTWRDVAERWKEVGKQVKDLGDRLGSAFKEGWATDEVSEEETRKVVDRLRELGEKMDRAVDSMREEAKQPETKAVAKETWDATRGASTEFLDELRETLSEGLREVNKRVDDLVQKRKGKKEAE